MFIWCSITVILSNMKKTFSSSKKVYSDDIAFCNDGSYMYSEEIEVL